MIGPIFAMQMTSIEWSMPLIAMRIKKMFSQFMYLSMRISHSSYKEECNRLKSSQHSPLIILLLYMSLQSISLLFRLSTQNNNNLLIRFLQKNTNRNRNFKFPLNNRWRPDSARSNWISLDSFWKRSCFSPQFMSKNSKSRPPSQKVKS